jgi:hypothetical protein
MAGEGAEGSMGLAGMCRGATADINATPWVLLSLKSTWMQPSGLSWGHSTPGVGSPHDNAGKLYSSPPHSLSASLTSPHTCFTEAKTGSHWQGSVCLSDGVRVLNVKCEPWR